MNEEHKKIKLDVKAIDRAVYVLTNRPGSFTSGTFSNSPYFKPWDSPSDEWLQVQKALMLDKRNTDYYIMAALNLLETHSYLKDKIENNVPSYSIHNFPSFSSDIEGAEIVVYGNRNSNFKTHKEIFPIPEYYRLLATQGNGMSVNTEKGELHKLKPNIIRHRATTRDPNTYVIISGDWSDYLLPFEGAFKIVGQWNPGDFFTINYHPKNIDYKAWLSHIEKEINVDKFLNKVGLLETFRLSKQTTEKIAVFYLALIRHWDIENK